METWGRTEWRLRGTSCEKEGWKGHSGEGDGRGREGGRECRRGRRREKTTLSLSLSPNKTPDIREILKLKCRWSVTTSSSWSADRAGLQIVRDFQPLQSFLSISIIIIWASRVSMLPILSQTDELNIPAKLYSTGRSSHALFRWFVGCWYFVHSSCNHQKMTKRLQVSFNWFTCPKQTVDSQTVPYDLLCLLDTILFLLPVHKSFL